MVKLVIGADIVVTKENEALFIEGDPNKIVGEALYAFLREADLRIFNLETVFCDDGAPIDKCGPHMGAPTAAFLGVANLMPSVLSLANNHILDYGAEGMRQTLGQLERYGIRGTGAGATLAEAERPLILEKNGVRIGLYACSEHEFSIATPNSAGANPYDPLTSFDSVERLKSECDFVIVLYHGGKEYYPYPSPRLQRIFRKFADKGADLVVSQHTHCIGCMERYNGASLVYGQGNFIYYKKENPFHQTSILLELEIRKSEGTVAYSFNPVPICASGVTVAMAGQARREEIRSAFDARSAEILRDHVIEEKYASLSRASLVKYCSRSMGRIRNGLIGRLLYKLSGGKFATNAYGKPEILGLLNIVECEAHNELFIEGLKSRLRDMSEGE